MTRNRIRDLARNPWHAAALLLLLALFLTNVYRAAAQSITHDEGVMYEWFLSGPWSQLFAFGHGNHHVAAEILAKLSIEVFGTSDFAIRIPALLGGLLYFSAMFGISVFLFGDGYLSLLSVALLALNPLVLDYLVCARGYGLALGFFFWSLYLVARYLGEPSAGSARLLNYAGVALGLSIGSNPIMVIPGGALVASMIAMLAADAMLSPVSKSSAPAQVRDSRKERRRKSKNRADSTATARGWRPALLHFVLPAVAVGGFFSILPARLIELEPGYTGPASLAAILEGLLRYSLFHSPVGFAGLIGWLPAESVVRFVAVIVVPAGLIALLLVAAQVAIGWKAIRKFDVLPKADRFLLLLAGMIPLSILLIVVSRYVFHGPYPELRTAVYWLPLLSLAGMTLAKRLSENSSAGRIGAAAVAAICGICVVQFATQFNTRYFAEWAYCAGGKDMMQALRADHAGKAGAGLKVGATWQLEPVINFYRAAWSLNWMEPVVRESPDNFFDYYFLAYTDVSLVDNLHLKKISSDRLSGTVLARRGDL